MALNGLEWPILDQNGLEQNSSDWPRNAQIRSEWIGIAKLGLRVFQILAEWPRLAQIDLDGLRFIQNAPGLTQNRPE